MAGNDNEDKKVKLTRVPGAVLFQYVDKEVDYEIGEEIVHFSAVSQDIGSNASQRNSSSEEEEINTQKAKDTKKIKNRPASATTKTCKRLNVDTNSGKSQETITEEKDTEEKGVDSDEKNSFGKNMDRVEEGEESEQAFKASTSFKAMNNLYRDEAKQSIIDTINSYEDDRFPSRGTDYANLRENAVIEDSVASEILNKTLKYKEDEFYRQCDLMNSHAGKIDNRTNCILEHISDRLAHEYSLPEVSNVLQAHMEATERRWLAGEFVPYALQESPPESVYDDNETTLTPSHDCTFEDTLTEDLTDKTGVGRARDKSPENNNDDGIELSNIINDVEDAAEVFEDCVDPTDSEFGGANDGDGREFERTEETFTLEMKIALGNE